MQIFPAEPLSRFREFVNEKLLSVKRTTSYLGLDIGSFSVKMVRVSTEKDKVSLRNYGMSRIEDNNVSQAIRKVIGDSNVDAASVNIGLSGQGVILRYAVLPKMPLKELRQSVGTEVDKYIPFPAAQVFLDCHILKELPREHKVLVLIAAAKKDLVQKRIKLLSDLNLELNVIDINSMALVNGFNELRSKHSAIESEGSFDGKSHAIAILNIGANISCLNILEDNIPKLSRDIYIGGNNFSKKIAYKLNLDFAAAEQLKCNPGEDQWPKNLETCELLLNNLTHELRISFDYYETENNIPIRKLYLCGGGASFKGIDSILSKSLGIETEIWDPTPYLQIDPTININDFKSKSSELAIAAGLALR